VLQNEVLANLHQSHPWPQLSAILPTHECACQEHARGGRCKRPAARTQLGH
jgi:hypothetical protein